MVRKHRNALVAAVMAFAPIVAVSAAPSCSENAGTGAEPVDAGAIDSGMSANQPPDADAGTRPDAATDGGVGACDPLPTSDGLWHMPVSGWQPVGWSDTGCGVDIAEDPVKGAPPFCWLPCSQVEFPTGITGEYPGCEIQKTTWPWEGGYPWVHSSVVPWRSGHRIAQAMLIGAEWLLVVLYDEQGVAVASWRMPAAPKGRACDVRRPLVTPSHVWLSHSNKPTGATNIAVPFDDLAGTSTPSPLTSWFQWWHAQDDLVVAWLLDGQTIEVLDHTQNQLLSVPGPSFAAPYVVGDHVVALAISEPGHPELAVWSRATGIAETVVETTLPDRVYVANSDTQTLVWIVQSGDAEAPGTLWTSPFATTPAQVVATPRRPTPPVGLAYSTAGAGFFAVHSVKGWMQAGPGDGNIHLYRLSDAREWAFAPPGEAPIWAMLHVDQEYLYYQPTWTLARQRLDALGPGTAAP
jgi:hypothetical protein